MWSLSSMSKYVSFQIWLKWKCLSTLFTLMWSLSSMSENVSFQMILPWKCLSTLFALMWSLSRMSEHVTFQMLPTWKCLSTLFTSFSSMSEHVSFQTWLLCKCLSTLFTLIWSLSSVSDHVTLQISLLCKCLLTYWTLNRLHFFAAFRELSDDMHVDVALNVTLSQLNYKCMYCWNWTNVKHFWVMVFYFQTVIKFLNLSQCRGLINSHVTKWLIRWQWSRIVSICCIKVQSSMWIN